MALRSDAQKNTEEVIADGPLGDYLKEKPVETFFAESDVSTFLMSLEELFLLCEKVSASMGGGMFVGVVVVVVVVLMFFANKCFPSFLSLLFARKDS